ncbi:vascular endothelial growth factor receptor 2 [Cephus cinctus]|uniref:Vascular endothelial growth factor receptor 2 n=1 Tax=Cephus cinctus TaxID=211228 RepID=A0AAJ7FHE0_CEPCN|nr:vascular endothelial growth factor receptor 2 [Cephus cinctus]
MSAHIKIKSYTVRLLLIITIINVTKIFGKNITESVGLPHDLTVTVFEDVIQVEDNSTYELLKFNVSWLPPEKGRLPSSYSVLITTVSNGTEEESANCPEDSLYYTTKNRSQLNALLPENRFMSVIPEINIIPTCTYSIQVHANPRKNPKLKSPTVIYTVPECVGHQCSCINSSLWLPIPTVFVERQEDDNILINWNITVRNAKVTFFVISIGVPLLTSKNGLPVYNTTRIARIPSESNSFVWRVPKYDKFNHFGGKVTVAVEDEHGCIGTEGIFHVNSMINRDDAKQIIIKWIAFTVLLATSAMIFGILIFIWYQNRARYKLLLFSNRDTKRIQAVRTISKRRSGWEETILKNRNILYVEQEVEEAMCRGDVDKFEVSYQRIKFVRELGKGQFGKVYLSHLIEYNDDSLVAVKMSQFSDPSNEWDARSQLMEEISIMKAAGTHPHLVKLIGCCTLPNNPVCVILEYMENGDLLAYLHRMRESLSSFNDADSSKSSPIHSPRPSITETLYTTLSSEPPTTPTCLTFSSNYTPNNNSDAVHNYVNLNDEKESYQAPGISSNTLETNEFLRFALEIAKGMEHLESKRITHRDLAARNILLDSNLTLKISDFGLSRDSLYVMGNGAGGVRRLPVRWMSPEALRERVFSSKSDVWSFGVVMWEIGTLGALPYHEIRDDQFLQHVLRNEGRLARPQSVSFELYEVMRSCWASRVEHRPTFGQLIHHLRSLSGCPYSIWGRNNPCYTSLLPTKQEIPDTPLDSSFLDTLC